VVAPAEVAGLAFSLTGFRRTLDGVWRVLIVFHFNG